MIFIDSSYFLALLNENDSSHDEAKKLAVNIDERYPSEEKGITQLVFHEIVTGLAKMISKEKAKEIGTQLLDKFRIYPITLDQLRTSLTIIGQYDEHPISVCDATSVLVIKEHAGLGICSVDHRSFNQLCRSYGIMQIA